MQQELSRVNSKRYLRCTIHLKLIEIKLLNKTSMIGYFIKNMYRYLSEKSGKICGLIKAKSNDEKIKRNGYTEHVRNYTRALLEVRINSVFHESLAVPFMFSRDIRYLTLQKISADHKIKKKVVEKMQMIYCTINWFLFLYVRDHRSKSGH